MPFYSRQRAVKAQHIRALCRISPLCKSNKGKRDGNALYFATGSGLRDGSSIENAGTIANLNKYIAAAGPGGQVLLLADQGAYQQNTQLSISAGGRPARRSPSAASTAAATRWRRRSPDRAPPTGRRA